MAELQRIENVAKLDDDEIQEAEDMKQKWARDEIETTNPFIKDKIQQLRALELEVQLKTQE